MLNHEGNGHQLKINKNAAADTASVLFQNGFSGRAEFGLTGDDDWHVKVSPDGSAWADAIKIGKDDGLTAVNGLRHLPTGGGIASLMFTPGGDGVISLYRIDVESGQNPRTATVSSVSSDTITLTAAVANTIFDNARMNGVSCARIWNTSKSPEQSAWVKAAPAGNQLTVVNAGDIAVWSTGETIQIGDPTGIISSRVVTLDISPMLINLFGQAFPQSGIMVKASIAKGTGGTDGDSLGVTPSGAGGSFVSAAQLPSSSGVTVIPCTDPSPISNSNLVRLRESVAGTAGIRLVSSIAVFV